MIISKLDNGNNPYIVIDIEREINTEEFEIKSILKKVTNQQHNNDIERTKHKISFAKQIEIKIVICTNETNDYTHKHFFLNIENKSQNDINTPFVNKYIEKKLSIAPNEKLLLSIINNKNKSISKEQIIDCITTYVNNNYDSFKTKLLNKYTSEDNDKERKGNILEKDVKDNKEILINKLIKYVNIIRMKTAEKRSIVAINSQAISILEKHINSRLLTE